LIKLLGGVRAFELLKKETLPIELSDFDEKFFTKEENKQFGPILVRLREFEKSVAHSLREINSNLEELNTKENQTKNSLTATKGSITKLSNKIWEKLREIENKLNENL